MPPRSITIQFFLTKDYLEIDIYKSAPFSEPIDRFIKGELKEQRLLKHLESQKIPFRTCKLAKIFRRNKSNEKKIINSKSSVKQMYEDQQQATSTDECPEVNTTDYMWNWHLEGAVPQNKRQETQIVNVAYMQSER